VARIEGKNRLLVLGSFEVLCPHFSEAEKSPIEAQWRHLLPCGLRLIVFADGCGDNLDFRIGLPQVALRPLALVIFRDELRPNVANVLKSLADQNIRVKVISGDHPETVRATVGSLGEVFKEKQVLTGDEWEASKDPISAANHCDFFGRVYPEQKLALIRALQDSGHNVGMIGDGVNDILPIKRANFGVAMGSGSPATKAVAALLLESNDFSVLPQVLMESRRVVQNVRVAAKLFLLKNAYTIALILVAVGCFGSPFPYLPQQVTLLNALTIGGPAVIILAGRSSLNRAYGASFYQDVGRFLWIAGGATSMASLVVFLGSIHIFGFDIEVTRTMLLVTLIVAGLANAVIATRGNRSLVIWAVAAFCLLLAISSFPPTSYFFALASLTRLQWALCLLGAVIAFAPTALFNANGVHEDENRPPKANGPMHGGTSDSG
jgi:magnesium-transporting ATPase (P-type)